MLTIDELYNISHGVFYSFKSPNIKATTIVNHKKERREKLYHLYDKALKTMTKNDYTILCLFVMFRYRPSSSFTLIDYLTYYDTNAYDNFKATIESPFKKLAKDLKYYFNEIDDIENINVPLEEYHNKNIGFYALYIIWKMTGYKLTQSISDNELLKYLYCLFKFLETPSDEWVNKVIDATR